MKFCYVFLRNPVKGFAIIPTSACGCCAEPDMALAVFIDRVDGMRIWITGVPGHPFFPRL
jgi:hypothetical protein